MGANLDYRFIVNILSSAPPVSALTFDNIMLVAEGATFAASQTKSYSSPTAVNADVELDAATKAYAVQLWNQTVNPGKIKICKSAGTDYGADLDLAKAEDPDFYGVCAVVKTVAARLEEMAAWVLTRDLGVCGISSSEAAILTGAASVLATLTTASNGRAAVLYHATDTEAADLVWLAHKLSANPDIDVTTWANLPLIGVAVDDLTDTERDQVIGDLGNLYLTTKGVGTTFPGVTAADSWIDTIISGDWLKARIESDIAQLQINLSNINSKIPYTDLGIAQIVGLVRKWLNKGETIGHFRPGSSNIVVPLVADIPSATIQARELTISASTILAGAIDQAVTVNIVVSET